MVMAELGMGGNVPEKIETFEVDGVDKPALVAEAGADFSNDASRSALSRPSELRIAAFADTERFVSTLRLAGLRDDVDKEALMNRCEDEEATVLVGAGVLSPFRVASVVSIDVLSRAFARGSGSISAITAASLTTDVTAAGDGLNVPFVGRAPCCKWTE